MHEAPPGPGLLLHEPSNHSVIADMARLMESGRRRRSEAAVVRRDLRESAASAFCRNGRVFTMAELTAPFRAISARLKKYDNAPQVYDA